MTKEKNSDFNKNVYPISLTVESLDPSSEAARGENQKAFKEESSSAEETFQDDDSSMAVVLIKTVISSFFYSFEEL